MSALLPKADMTRTSLHVHFVLEADIGLLFDHLVGARSRTDVGNSTPIALAVLRLITNLIGNSNGR